jgi:hypothetical protein
LVVERHPADRRRAADRPPLAPSMTLDHRVVGLDARHGRGCRTRCPTGTLTGPAAHTPTERSASTPHGVVARRRHRVRRSGTVSATATASGWSAATNSATPRRNAGSELRPLARRRSARVSTSTSTSIVAGAPRTSPTKRRCSRSALATGDRGDVQHDLRRGPRRRQQQRASRRRTRAGTPGTPWCRHGILAGSIVIRSGAARPARATGGASATSPHASRTATTRRSEARESKPHSNASAPPWAFPASRRDRPARHPGHSIRRHVPGPHAPRRARCATGRGFRRGPPCAAAAAGSRSARPARRAARASARSGPASPIWRIANSASAPPRSRSIAMVVGQPHEHHPHHRDHRQPVRAARGASATGRRARYPIGADQRAHRPQRRRGSAAAAPARPARSRSIVLTRPRAAAIAGPEPQPQRPVSARPTVNRGGDALGSGSRRRCQEREDRRELEHESTGPRAGRTRRRSRPRQRRSTARCRRARAAAR